MYWAFVVGRNHNTFRRRSRDRSFSSTGDSSTSSTLAKVSIWGDTSSDYTLSLAGICRFRLISDLLCSVVMRTTLTTASKETVDSLSVDVMVGMLLALVVYRITLTTDVDNVQYRAGSWRVEHTSKCSRNVDRDKCTMVSRLTSPTLFEVIL
jgi:hypothetical protein